MRQSRKKSCLVLLGVFVAVVLFTFLTQKFKNDDSAQAANVWAFDPGYIISDWQMSNYNSMSEADIQNFLTSKNPCNDRDYGKYLRESSTYPWKTWYWNASEGHFTCLSQERFGNTWTEVGAGESAAHIIWQTAQDYRINPQVLIVLLEKESGLITDTYPNSYNYRTATGYGCPDTAACDSQYFGLKNQLRHAAALFREVLDGGWTNYPLGNNYVRYNPNAACGGTIVNIRSRATSALYRYTPYQPNWSALNAGYGSGDSCGAYGNRNFYLLFEDWFGGITRENWYEPMTEPRYMITLKTTDRVKSNGSYRDTLEAGRMLKYTSKIYLPNGETCLRTEFGTTYDEDACVKMSDLENVKLNPQPITGENTQKIISPGAQKVRIRAEETSETFQAEMLRTMPVKVEFNGHKYYVTEFDANNTGSEYGFRNEDVRDAPSFEMFSSVSAVTFNGGNADRVYLESGSYADTLYKGNVYTFLSTSIINGVKYYRTEHNTINNWFWGVEENDLEKAIFMNFEEPREFITKGGAQKINPISGETLIILQPGTRVKFVTKVFVNGEWYYRTEFDTNNHAMSVVKSSELIDTK